MKREEFPYYPNWVKRNILLLLLWDFTAMFLIPVMFVLLVSMLSLRGIKGGLFLTTLSLFSFGFAASTGFRNQEYIRKYYMLPISKNTLAKVFWIVSVLVFPLSYLMLSPMVALIGIYLLHLPVWDMLIIVLLPTACSIVLSSISVLLPLAQNSHNRWIQVFSILGQMAVVFTAIFISALLVNALDLQASYLLTICIVLLVFGPIIVLSSFLRCRRLFPLPGIKQQKQKKRVPCYSHSRFSFWYQFWSQHFTLLGNSWLICIAGSLLFALLKGKAYMFGDFLFLIASFLMGVFLPALSVLLFRDIRPLRALPMSAKGLSFFLLSVPCVYIICTLLPLLLLYPATSMNVRLLHPLAGALFAFGFSVIACNAVLRFGESAVNFVLIEPALLVGVLLSENIHPSGYVMWIVLGLGLAMIPLLIYQIKHRSEAYRRRPSAMRNGAISGRR